MIAKKKKRPPPVVREAFGATTPPPKTLLLAPTPGTAMVVSEPANEEMSNQYLRYSAGVYYTTDLNCCTVEDMTRHPIYGAVPLFRLQKWCNDDEWVKRREANKEQWRKKIEAAVGSKLAQARVRQLESLQRIYDRALAKLEGEAVKAGTWEGVAAVLMRIAELMDDWRTKIAQEIWPAISEQRVDAQAPALVRPRLSQEEARAAAMVIIQKRREQLKAETEKEPKPNG